MRSGHHLWLANLVILGVCASVTAQTPDKAERRARRNAEAATPASTPAKPAEKKVVLPIVPIVPAELARAIDAAISAKLSAASVPASPRADDAEFLRRSYLDLHGVIPSADKVTKFLADTAADKRAKLLDELLADEHYGKHQADIWDTLLLPVNSDNRRLVNEPMNEWLAKAFNENRPWDKLVRDLLTASGTQEENGAVTFFMANPTADKLTDSVCKLFLGVQLQCAQCHNHPFTEWKQTEYWAMAQFFTKVRIQGNPKNAAKSGVTPSINEDGKGRPAKLPESAKTVPPKYLGAEAPKLGANEPYRPALAGWLAARDNPFFAKALVNRVWAQLFGRGFVNPIDDMQAGNAASHPELLDGLAKSFAEGGFDLKMLYRSICLSDAYQRTSKPAGNASDKKLFSHMAVKVLTPEQLYDSLTTVTGPLEVANGRAGKGAMAKRPGGNPREAFVNFFGVGDGTADPTTYQGGIPQALRLMNSPRVVPPQAAKRIVGSAAPEEAIEKLYLATLSRQPTAAERKRHGDYLRGQRDNAQAATDILWVLLNCSEFTCNH